jgi:hypothetical protein
MQTFEATQNNPQASIASSSRSRRRSAVQKMHIQARLPIGQPGDAYEVEADHIAAQVMRMPLQTVQRKCTACEEEEIQAKPLASTITPLVQAKGAGVQETPAWIESQINEARGGGSPLPDDTRSFMEGSIGADFSGVKVHTGIKSEQLNRSLNAQAFTVGNDVFFGAGKYSPDTTDGKGLLAHELTHVVQQGAAIERKIQRTVDANQVSCGSYAPEHPTRRVISGEIGATDPVEYIREAADLAISYLDDVISTLQYTRSRIVDDNEPVAYPTINDCVASAIALRFRRFNPENDDFWRGRRGVERLINWYTRIRDRIASDRLRYTCIHDFGFCGTTTWAGALPGRNRIYLCLAWWRGGLNDRALTIIHETSHIIFSTDDHNGRTMNNAHCIEQFIADLTGITIPAEFRTACGGQNDSCA